MEFPRRKSSRGDTPKRKFMSELDTNAYGPPEKESLHFDQSQFDEDTWNLMKAVIEEANRVLWHWKTFPIIVPAPIESKIEPQHGSTSSMRKKTLNMRDLFVEPNFDEMKAIALTAKGDLKRLTHEQLESVKQTGEFEVDSIEFPGQKHKWILTQILIKGKQKTHNTMLDNLANCLYLIVGLSRRLCINMLESLNGWSVGTMNLLDMLVGIPLIDTVGLEAKLQTERSKYLVAELKEAPCEEGKVQALCNYILQRQKKSIEEVQAYEAGQQPSKEKPPPIPYRFMTPQGLEIDLRLCNQEVMKSTKPHLLHILNQAMQDWIPDKRKELIKEYRAEGLSEEDISKTVKSDISNEYFDRVCKMIHSDQGIARIGGKDGIAELLVNQAKTAKIIGEVTGEEQLKQEKNKETVETRLKVSNPILSRVRSWTKRKLRRAHEQYVIENMWSSHQQAVIKCLESNLEQSAYFLTKDLSFRKDHEPMWANELKKFCKQPAKNFSFSSRIWMPKNWIVTESNKGKSEIIPTVVDNHSGDDTVRYMPPPNKRSPQDHEKGISLTADPDLTFSVEKKTYRTNNSGYPGWRWLNFFMRTNAIFWNTLFFFAIVIPWCTPFSLRALGYIEPFYPQWILDTKNGTIKKDRNSKTQTIMSRINSLWNHVRESRKKFESKPDTGLLSKSLTRQIHRFVNYFLKGFFGTAFIVTCLPLSMFLISTLSLVLALTAPIYIWVGSAIIHFLAFLFCDFEGDSKMAAVFWNVLINFLGIGILQPLGCALMAFVICPVSSVIGSLLSVLRKCLRDGWDVVIFQLLIRKQARMPMNDTFLAKRIAGPGMASTYYYQIKTEQALASLETVMDLDRLLAFKADIIRQIKKPEAEYKQFVTRNFGPFGAMVSTGNVSTPYHKLDLESTALLNQLEEKVKKRKEALDKKLPTTMRSIIRLIEEDLKIVLQQGTVMIETFYTENVMPKMTETEVKNFWFTKNLKDNDWLGLTSFLLSELFSPDFLTPLQELDATFSLKVKHWNLSRYLNMALEADWKDDLDVTRVMQTPKLGSFMGQPDIPLESFNPMAYPTLSFELKRRKDVWNVYKTKQVDLSEKLVNPLPLPHPIEITVIISNRDTLSHSQLKMDEMSFNALLRLIEDSSTSIELSINSPMSIQLHELKKSIGEEDSSTAKNSINRDESHSIYEMDPAMASLTQSLEELDRDVEDEIPKYRRTARLSLGGSGHNSPGIKKTGPGSVPLLASTEDITVIVSASKSGGSPVTKKVVNPDSYSTVV